MERRGRSAPRRTRGPRRACRPSPRRAWLLRRSSRRRCFFFQAEDGIRDGTVTGVQTCALPISTRAVLELEPERRTALLQRTILPGLLDGRADGTVLRDFPDMDLAESLCLLLELETAAPEVLTSAINRLGLTPERREAVVPLIDARIRAQQTGHTPSGG